MGSLFWAEILSLLCKSVIHRPHPFYTAMKLFIYALLLLCLPACRLSQSLPLVDTPESTDIPSIPFVAPPIASSASLIIRDEASAKLTKQTVNFPPKKSHQQHKQYQPNHFVRTTKARKVKRPSVAHTTGNVASELRPTRSLILAGAGVVILIISLLVAQHVTSFEGAIIVGSAVGVGAALIVVGLLLGLFSYLMGLYEKERVARAAMPKR